MRVVIFSIEEIVVEQLKSKAKIFPACSNMIITNHWDLAEWRKLPKAVFFFDEGEQLVEERLLGCSADEDFTGLAALHDRKMCLFSATLSPYWMKCFEATFGYHAEMFLKYDSVRLLTTGSDNEQIISVSCRKTTQELLASMFDKIDELILERPILIFVTKDDPSVIEKITAKVAEFSNIECNYINSIEGALAANY